MYLENVLGTTHYKSVAATAYSRRQRSLNIKHLFGDEINQSYVGQITLLYMLKCKHHLICKKFPEHTYCLFVCPILGFPNYGVARVCL